MPQEQVRCQASFRGQQPDTREGRKQRRAGMDLPPSLPPGGAPAWPLLFHPPELKEVLMIRHFGRIGVLLSVIGTTAGCGTMVGLQDWTLEHPGCERTFRDGGPRVYGGTRADLEQILGGDGPEAPFFA